MPRPSPGRDRSLGLAPDRDQGLLCQVLGDLAGRAASHQHGLDARRVEVEQRLERLAVLSGCDGANEGLGTVWRNPISLVVHLVSGRPSHRRRLRRTGGKMRPNLILPAVSLACIHPDTRGHSLWITAAVIQRRFSSVSLCEHPARIACPG